MDDVEGVAGAGPVELDAQLARRGDHQIQVTGESDDRPPILPHEVRGKVRAQRIDIESDRVVFTFAPQHRTLRDQRVAFEIHLRDEPLRPGVAGEREVDVRGPPGVVMIPPGIATRFDGHKSVEALMIGQGVAATGEVGVQRSIVLVPRM